MRKKTAADTAAKPATSVLRPLVALGLLGALGACHGPLRQTDADGWHTWGGPPPPLHRPNFGEQVLLYLPNRVVDLMETVSVSFGVGVSPGIDLRVTQWGQLALQAGAGAGFQWDGRNTDPRIATAYVTAAAGPWRTASGTGRVAAVEPWEIAVGAGGQKFGIDLAEVADFLLGWFFLDIQGDDYGWIR